MKRKDQTSDELSSFFQLLKQLGAKKMGTYISKGYMQRTKEGKQPSQCGFGTGPESMGKATSAKIFQRLRQQRIVG